MKKFSSLGLGLDLAQLGTLVQHFKVDIQILPFDGFSLIGREQNNVDDRLASCVSSLMFLVF